MQTEIGQSGQGETAPVDGAVDVAVIGAGLAGLVCAQRLKQAGLRVVILEKSRGLGGRLATRRLPGTCADHGVRYLTVQGELTQQLIESLVQQDLLQPWLNPLAAKPDQPIYYSASSGLTVVAKWLAADLEIWSGQRLHRLTPTSAGWQLELEAQLVAPASAPASATNPALQASSVVMAIPAPQAQVLLEPLAEQMPELVKAVRRAEFAPCLTVIATYSVQPPAAITAQLTEPVSANLAWVSLENSKGRNPQIPTFVVQSTAEFASLHLDTNDLEAVGKMLLDEFASLLSPALATWLSQPTLLQVHRWRYGLVHQPLTKQCLAAATPLPLVCCGDWCGGHQVEAALASGLAAAHQVGQLLKLATASMSEAASLKSDFSTLLMQLMA